jgi:hypothetical protein
MLTHELDIFLIGILRNVSPLPPPSAASFVDIDKDIVLPLLQPVISSISLAEVSALALDLVTKDVSHFGRLNYG